MTRTRNEASADLSGLAHHARRERDRIGIYPGEILFELRRRESAAGQGDIIVNVGVVLAANGDMEAMEAMEAMFIRSKN